MVHLYNHSLIPGSAITAACVGNFSGTKQQEICVARGGQRIELLKTDPNTGKLESLVEADVFGQIRSISSFKLTGGTKGQSHPRPPAEWAHELLTDTTPCPLTAKDYIIIGSDSGRIVVLEYDPVNNAFNKLHQETYGRSGSRRIVPGQYLATDPKGRAVMIGAMEKSKLVYILNRVRARRW